MRLSAHFRERLPLLPQNAEVEYPGLVRELLAAFGIDVSSDEELNRYLEAEHAAWDPAMQVGATSVALLESSGAASRTGLVSSATDPGWLLRADLERQGLATLLDAVAFSSELGKAEAAPGDLQFTAAGLGVAPDRALFVGDRLVEDVQGPAELGMTTVQAVWFRRRREPERDRADYQAFTQMDVLNVVERLRGRLRASRSS